MKFRFIGNPNDRTDSRGDITFFGVHFKLGEPVEVENETIIAKLRGNGHFEEVKTRQRGEPDADKPTAKPAEQTPPPHAQPGRPPTRHGS